MEPGAGEQEDRTADLVPLLAQIMAKNPACAECNAPSTFSCLFSYLAPSARDSHLRTLTPIRPLTGLATRPRAIVFR